MADMKLINSIAVKWHSRFVENSDNLIELIDTEFGKDCAMLEFEMDCGNAFFEKYGNAANSSEALEKIIDEVDDIDLLGSAIYSQWRYFTHWAGSGAEILMPENAAWFITALKRLEKLSSTPNGSKGSVILFPDFEELKKEVKKLHTEISMLMLERDELRFVICKNLENAYMLELGSLEYKVFELNCEVQRLKRKIDLIQAKKNRQEKIVLSAIEEILDEEFAEFQQQLDEQIDKMNKALEYSKGKPLTDEEMKEIKKLYRSIVKALHPDLHPQATPAQIRLLQNAVEAYENGDLNALCIVWEMVAEPVEPEYNEDGLSVLIKEKERLHDTLKLVKEQISTIKSEFPYNMKEMISDPEKMAKRREELEEMIEELKELHDIYSARLNEMLR